MDNNNFTKDDVKVLASHMTHSPEYISEYIEVKAQIQAIKAYIESDKYFNRFVVKKILGMEITEDDD
ncbi:MAG: hypothetical protein Q4G23_03360 [Clostridia bacterium]|nr:hypothetical protein [Clostridia bacterium]